MKLFRMIPNGWPATLGGLAVWLLSLAVVGCATPQGSSCSHRLGAATPQGSNCSPHLGAAKPPTGPAQAGAALDRIEQRCDELQFQLAEARWKRNEIAACQQTLEEIIAHNPGHRGAQLRLAELHLLKGHPLQALSLMQRFCRTNRKDAEAHHLLGMAYEAIGQGDRALAAYDVAATLDPEDAIVRISLEDAVAARESPRRGGASRRTAGTQSLDDDVHRGLAQGAPSRSPSGGAASDDGDEPGLLDRSAAAEEPSDRSGPLVQIVPVDVSSKGGADEDQAWSGAEASDELSADDDTPLRLPRLPSASPVRWAYELEVGHVKPAGPQRLDDRQPAGDETEAADINDPPR